MKPRFSTLIALTFLSVALLAPFALSPIYLPVLRERAFELHLTLQGNIYKQITGYASLIFVLLEMIFTARKRGRGWKIKIKVPGSMQFWRQLHIFLGVGLLATTLVHTLGSTGLNFNAIFLWVFFGVTLSALVGVVAETGLLESPKRYFSFSGGSSELSQKTDDSSNSSVVSKGELIRWLRIAWLTTHILLVSVFLVMLVFHIFLAYYYA
ncbi:MAG: hypothetical protein ACFBSC_11240 [Microcoleaceae cyanobacterium]